MTTSRPFCYHRNAYLIEQLTLIPPPAASVLFTPQHRYNKMQTSEAAGTPHVARRSLAEQIQSGLPNSEAGLSFQEYSYSPLKAESEIRLIKLQSRQDRSIEIDHVVFPIYEIVHVELDDDPEYEVLSYAWGDLSTLRPFFFEGNQFLGVTASLFGALLRHCPTDGSASKYLWADQICINQKDLTERSRQVQRMTQIFARASLCCVWLGESDESSSDVFELIQEVTNSGVDILPLRSTYHFRDMPSKDIRKVLMNDPASEHLPEIFDPRWHAVARLLRRPWFTRLWVFQEVVVPKSVQFSCGEHVCTLEELFGASYLLPWDYLDHVHGRSTNDLVYIYRSFYFYNQPGTLLSMLTLMRLNFVCSDPKDRVYGVLGIPTTHGGNQIIVDYSKSTHEIYTETARTIIETSGSLKLLETLDPGSSGWIPETPSWVPDWNIRSTYGSVGTATDNFKADRNRRHQTDETDAFGNLTVKGRVVDSVQSLITNGYEIKSTQVQWLDWVEEVLERCSSMLYDRLTVSSSGENCPSTIREIIIRTITLNGLLRGGAWAGMGWKSDEWSREGINRMLEEWKLFRESKTDLQESPEHLTTWMERLMFQSRVSAGRQLAVFRNAHLGVAPNGCQEGDLVCILHGSVIPVILRPKGLHYVTLGLAYVDGIMYGEAVTWAEEEAYEFVLI